MKSKQPVVLKTTTTKAKLKEFAEKLIDIHLKYFEFSCFSDSHFVYTCRVNDDSIIELSFFIKDGECITSHEKLTDILKVIDSQGWKDIRLLEDKLNLDYHWLEKQEN